MTTQEPRDRARGWKPPWDSEQQDQPAAAATAGNADLMNQPLDSGGRPQTADPSPRPDLLRAVDRFLSWRLPDDFAPDCGVSFDRRGKDSRGYEKQWPVGTNLLTAEQARAMFEYCLQPAAADAAARLSYSRIIRQISATKPNYH